jgi:four helix bundle protein
MEKTKMFEDLLVWQKAHEFVLLVYKTTESFPKHEIFGLTFSIQTSGCFHCSKYRRGL